MNIIVICGAGASSTFVAHRIRRAAAGADVRVTPTSEGELESLLDGADVVLIGEHLHTQLDALRQTAGDVPVVVLPAVTASDGAAALELALGAAGR